MNTAKGTPILDDAQKQEWQKATWKNTTALQVVTAGCHALLKVNFPTPDEKPDWFDPLVASLDVIKEVAGEWVSTMAPDLTTTIPNTVINFRSTFFTVTDEILHTAQKHGDAIGADNPHVKKVSELLGALEYRINGIIGQVAAMEERLLAWQQKMQDAFAKYRENAENIKKVHGELQAQCTLLESQIEILRENINTYNMIGIGGFVAEMAGYAIMIGGVVATIATGPAGALVVAGGGLLTVTGNVAQASAENSIVEANEQIMKTYGEVEEKKRQILAVAQLAANSKFVEDTVDTSLQALSHVRTMWTGFKNTIKTVVDKLNEANAALPLGNILNTLAIKDARNQWEEVTITARNIMQMKVTVEHKQEQKAA